MPCSKCKCQSTHTAVETFLGLREVFFLLLSQEKRGSFHSPLCFFPQTAVSASHFSHLLYNEKETPFQAYPHFMCTVPAVRAKQVVFFPCPVGCACWVWSFQPFLVPKDTSLGTEAQKLSCSRAVGASASTCIANTCVLLSPFPSSLEAMVLTLTWPSHASCLTPALFQSQNLRICSHFKAFVILHRSVILPGGLGAAWAWCSSSAAAGQQIQSLSGTFSSCLRSNLCSCCMQMVAGSHRNLPNKYMPCQLRRKAILGWKGAEQEPSHFLLSIQQAVQTLQPLSKAAGKARQTLPAGNKSHFS